MFADETQEARQRAELRAMKAEAHDLLQKDCSESDERFQSNLDTHGSYSRSRDAETEINAQITGPLAEHSSSSRDRTYAEILELDDEENKASDGASTTRGDFASDHQTIFSESVIVPTNVTGSHQHVTHQSAGFPVGPTVSPDKLTTCTPITTYGANARSDLSVDGPSASSLPADKSSEMMEEVLRVSRESSTESGVSSTNSEALGAFPTTSSSADLAGETRRVGEADWIRSEGEDEHRSLQNLILWAATMFESATKRVTWHGLANLVFLALMYASHVLRIILLLLKLRNMLVILLFLTTLVRLQVLDSAYLLRLGRSGLCYVQEPVFNISSCLSPERRASSSEKENIREPIWTSIEELLSVANTGTLLFPVSSLMQLSSHDIQKAGNIVRVSKFTLSGELENLYSEMETGSFACSKNLQTIENNLVWMLDITRASILTLLLELDTNFNAVASSSRVESFLSSLVSWLSGWFGNGRWYKLDVNWVDRKARQNYVKAGRALDAFVVEFTEALDTLTIAIDNGDGCIETLLGQFREGQIIQFRNEKLVGEEITKLERKKDDAWFLVKLFNNALSDSELGELNNYNSEKAQLGRLDVVNQEAKGMVLVVQNKVTGLRGQMMNLKYMARKIRAHGEVGAKFGKWFGMDLTVDWASDRVSLTQIDEILERTARLYRYKKAQNLDHFNAKFRACVTRGTPVASCMTQRHAAIAAK